MNSFISDDIRKYIDLRISAAKLNIASRLSVICRNIISIIVILFLIIIILAFGGLVLMHYLDDSLGEPWGALVTIGVFVLLLILAVRMRDQMFKRMVNRAFTNAMQVKSDDIDKDIKQLESDIDKAESHLDAKYNNIVFGISMGAAIVSKIVDILKSGKK